MFIKKRAAIILLAMVIALGFATPYFASDTYVVAENDVLWRIARAYDLTWQELAEYNNLRNPHHIEVGQVLHIPAHEMREYEITIGNRWPVGGTLTLPAGASARNPVPAVLLVHGSGPADRDSTIMGINRPFYDIAEYLSAHGVAVLRYDKATYIHGWDMVNTLGASFTVWEETIEHAVYAAQLLHHDPRISSVYIAGLSLGGMLAPRIHAAGGNFDGLILMAGSPRTLMDISLDQNYLNLDIMHMQIEAQFEMFLSLAWAEEYDFIRFLLADTAEMFGLNLFAMDNDALIDFVDMLLDMMESQLLAAIDAVYALELLYAAIPTMTAEEAKAVLIDPMSSMYAYYMRDMAINPVDGFLRDISAPFLVMQGTHDFQIFADVDFVLYQFLLGDRNNASFILYEGLNHLFMTSAATNILEALEEYAIPSQVHPRVLADMVAWIMAQR
jgi:hypothetical protein